MSTWTLLARHPDRSVAGMLRGYSFTLTLRLNEVGSWDLSIPPELTPAGWPVPGSGLVFMRDGRVVASGNWDVNGFRWTADPSDDAGGQGKYTFNGDTDLGRIAYHIVYPSPMRAWNDQILKTHYEATDLGETVLRAVVQAQCGTGTPSVRRVPGLVIADGNAAGTNVAFRERFTPLLEALRTTALVGGGLAFDVRDRLDGNVEFSVRAPADLTETARFGRELGNVVDLEIQQTSPVATVALVAGSEEGLSRHALEVSGVSSAGTSLWDASTVPATASHADAKSAELGVKFSASVSGTVTGIRFYKGTLNTGTHVASLWTLSGTRLATATFSGETASGWQQVNFSTPVTITPGTTYVASYFTPTGGYARNVNYFASTYINGPLSAPAGDNGVFAYTASPAFPAGSFQSTNYWVDVVFTPTVLGPWGRRELFVDQRQVRDADAPAGDPTPEELAEYAKAADEALANNGEQYSISAVTLDTPELQWGRDYSLGDRVSVITPFGPISDLVKQVEIKVSDTGVEDIRSTIGATDLTTEDPLAETVRRLAAQISKLQRER